MSLNCSVTIEFVITFLFFRGILYFCTEKYVMLVHIRWYHCVYVWTCNIVFQTSRLNSCWPIYVTIHNVKLELTYITRYIYAFGRWSRWRGPDTVQRSQTVSDCFCSQLFPYIFWCKKKIRWVCTTYISAGNHVLKTHSQLRCRYTADRRKQSHVTVPRALNNYKPVSQWENSRMINHPIVSVKCIYSVDMWPSSF
jgi:hypothetical protein